MNAPGGPEQTFAVASDECLIELIQSARNQIVVVAPALTITVAAELAERCDDPRLSLSVVLDADAEVYRLGYGDEAALETLRHAMTTKGLALTRQPGVRIGIIIADERMLVYSPVPRLIEAGSPNREKPNAVMLAGASAKQVATATTGGDNRLSEIGCQGLGPDDIRRVETDLANEPPQKFDIARAIRVFSSQAEFVELKVENLRANVRRVPLPPDLLGIRSEDLLPRITGALSAPAEVNGPFEIPVEQADGKTKNLIVDSGWVNQQRAAIENEFTFLVPRHGRVILIREKQAFEVAVERFERNIETYMAAAREAFAKSRESFKQTLSQEFLPAWKASPPPNVTRFYPKPSDDQIRECLSERLDHLLDKASTLQPIRCTVLYKGITWNSANDPSFTKCLTDAMKNRGFPKAVVEKLFSEFNAAKGSSAQPEPQQN